MNGSVSYSYDPVGNRTQKVSTLPGYPGGLTNYNANDQLSTDTYDNNGNTTQSQGKGYVYDFENHLISANGVTYTYDGEGHRVSKTVNGKTITYATSDVNPTGYSQVISETYSPQPCGGDTQHTYVYGLEGVLERRGYYDGSCNGKTQYLYFVHDPDLGLYFNPARYLNVSTGRFWTMDTFEGGSQSPSSLHKYLYAGVDPVDRRDPSSRDFIDSLTAAAITIGTLANQAAIVATTVLGTVYQCSIALTCPVAPRTKSYDTNFAFRDTDEGRSGRPMCY